MWPQRRRVWAVVTLLLTVGTAVSAILASLTLDTFMERPAGGGSMTTMLPGAVYAMATVMKVCLVLGGVSALIAASTWIAGDARHRSGAWERRHSLPGWGLAAITLVAAAPLFGAAGALIAQSFVAAGSGLTLADLPRVARAAVFVQIAVLAAGALSAAVSFARRERPPSVALVGLAASLTLIALFWHFQFYALRFDQDRWAYNPPHAPNPSAAVAGRWSLRTLDVGRAAGAVPGAAAAAVARTQHFYGRAGE